MNGAQVIQLLDALRERDLRVWVGGGWAVDAIVGHQTRPHQDLDVAIDEKQLGEVLGLLDSLGFTVSIDWLPTRVALTAEDGRAIDVHPVVFKRDGSGVQSGRDGESFEYRADGFTTGSIDGHRVPCLSVEQQLEFREGYDLREVDRHDLELLHRARGE